MNPTKSHFSRKVLARPAYELNLNYAKKQIAPDNSVKKKLQGDPRAVEMTRESNREDMELYSFALTEIFPRMCAKVGVNPEEKVESLAVLRDKLSLRFEVSGFYRYSGRFTRFGRWSHSRLD